MRIATWNVDRLKHNREKDSIFREISKVDADILVLTETDMRLCPDYPYHYHTLPPVDTRAVYRNTEFRVSVFSQYRCVKQYETYNEHTAVCVELESDYGNILVYGTIMGVLGNREASFKKELREQMKDIRSLSATGKPICIIGDYNLSFHDRYYFTTEGRNLVNQTFDDCGIDLLTKDMPECIDHVAISKSFFDRNSISVQEWNTDKSLSDHKGIVVEIRCGGIPI